MMLFNPYSGKPRHPSDIKSDPKGVLMVDPDAPLRPARPELAEAAILSLASRSAWRHRQSSDPHHSDSYTFNTVTLLGFVRNVIALHEARP